MAVKNALTIQEIITRGRIIPLFTHTDVTVCRKVLRICYEAGMPTFEYTNRSIDSYSVFLSLKAFRDAELPGMKLGIGTIKNAHQAEQYIKAGADFLVSPLFLSEIGVVASKHNILWVPGCATPSDIGMAENAGLSLVKVFPAKQLGGPDYIKAVKAIFPEMQFMATGGVEPKKEDIKDWFEAGAEILGLGSQLFPKQLLMNEDYETIRKNIAALINDIESIKTK